LNHVNFIALRAKYLDTAVAQGFAESHRNTFLIIAESPGTEPKLSLQKFPKHFGQA